MALFAFMSGSVASMDPYQWTPRRALLTVAGAVIALALVGFLPPPPDDRPPTPTYPQVGPPTTVPSELRTADRATD